MNNFKRKMNSGEIAVGSHVSSIDPVSTEILGDVGFDYIWIDMEHTCITLEVLQNHLLATRAIDTSAIVRVIWNEPYFVKPILEMGVDGIVFPMVNNANDAKKAVESCFYPPLGNRGVGPKRAVRYGLSNVKKYFKEESREVMVFIQIETSEAVNNIEEILQVEKITGFVIGPMDLSASLGYLGDYKHSSVNLTINKVIEKIHSSGKKVGTSVGNFSKEEFFYWIEKGMDFISAGSEIDYIVKGAKSTFKNAKFAINKLKRQ